jgi:hypothetical protein
MKTKRTFPLPEMLLCCLLLSPVASSSQRPPTPGTLTVMSAQQGAEITIDDHDTGRRTNSAFAVSPGTHTVSLPSLPNCKAPTTVTISSGSKNSVNCEATGWQKQS